MDAKTDKQAAMNILVQKENNLRINEKLRALHEKRRLLDEHITKNRMKIVTESKWIEIINWIREKLMSKHVEAEKQLASIKDVQSSEYINAKKRIKIHEDYYKSKAFTAIVVKQADKQIGLDKNPAHQNLIAQRNEVDQKISDLELIYTHINNPKEASLDDYQQEKVTDVVLVMTGEEISKNLKAYMLQQYRDSDVIDIAIDARSKIVFDAGFAVADQNQLRQEAIAKLHPELTNVVLQKQQIEKSIDDAKLHINQLQEQGKEKGFSKDGNASKWRPDFMKSGFRMEWEENLAHAQQLLKTRQLSIIDLDKNHKKIINNIKNNGIGIEKFMKDSFQPQYDKDSIYMELVEKYNKHTVNIQTAKDLATKLNKHQNQLFEVSSRSPDNIIKTNEISEQVTKINAKSKEIKEVPKKKLRTQSKKGKTQEMSL